MLVIENGKPKAGHEARFYLAWKHRVDYLILFKKTPWYKFKDRRRRWKLYLKSIDRTYKHGERLVI